MILPDKIICDFIENHHVLTLSTSTDSESWCCNCFYVYLKDRVSFLITSDTESLHARMISDNPIVSGTVFLETKKIGEIRGIQFKAEIKKLEGKDYVKHKLIYLKQFPYAILKKSALWIVKIDYIKMTDNRLGFGKKIHWERKL